MKDQKKTKAQLIAELEEIRQRLSEFEQIEIAQGRAETDLLESDKEYRNLFESMVLGVVYQSADGQIISANPAAEHILGLTLDQMRGRTSIDPRWKAIHEDGSDFPGETHPSMVSIKTGQPVHNVVMGVFHPEEEKHRWISIDAVPQFKLGEKRPNQVYTTFSDITERKRAEYALRRKAEELAALQITVLEITAPHDLPTLLQTVVERAAQLLGARSGGIYLSNPGSREVRCVVSYNTANDYTGTILKYGEGAAGTVAQTKEPLIIDDYRVWDKRADVYEEEQPFTTIISAPMIWMNQVTGVIHVLDNVESRRFTETDLALLTQFANHATIAVENARLYEEAQNEIIERKQAEEAQRQAMEALRENEEKYRILFDTEPDAIFLVDEDTGDLVDANPAAEMLYGYSKKEIVKLKAWDISAEPEETRRTIKLEGPSHVPLRYHKKKDGKVIIVEISANHCRIGERNINISMIRDITERVWAEKQVLDSLALTVATLESTDNGILVIDNNRKVVKSNTVFAELWRIPKELLDSGNDDELLDYVLDQLSDSGQFIAKVEELYNNPEQESFDVLAFKDGRVFERFSRPMIIDGKPSARVWSFRDVTERVMAEQALQEAHDMLEERVEERTEELTKVINFMAGREVRMADLKNVIKKLRKQIGDLGAEPIADDPLNMGL